MLAWLSVWSEVQTCIWPLTVSCFSETQIGFTFLVPAHLDSHGKRTIKRVCVSMVPEENFKAWQLSSCFIGCIPFLPQLRENTEGIENNTMEKKFGKAEQSILEQQ